LEKKYIILKEKETQSLFENKNKAHMYV